MYRYVCHGWAGDGRVLCALHTYIHSYMHTFIHTVYMHVLLFVLLRLCLLCVVLPTVRACSTNYLRSLSFRDGWMVQADERYKAANVRYCPHCGLQCLRTDGCDTVTCGRDAEDKGHKIQYGKGCMKKFNWETAARYVVRHPFTCLLAFRCEPPNPFLLERIDRRQALCGAGVDVAGTNQPCAHGGGTDGYLCLMASHRIAPPHITWQVRGERGVSHAGDAGADCQNG